MAYPKFIDHLKQTLLNNGPCIESRSKQPASVGVLPNRHTLGGRCRNVIILLLFALSFTGPNCLGDDATVEKSPQYIYVPDNDLQILFEKDQQGVLLSRERFEKLWQQRSRSIDANLPDGIAITAARYSASILGRQLSLTVEIDVLQTKPGLVSLPLAAKGLAIEKAEWNGEPASIGRKDPRSNSLYFFNDQPGRGTLKLKVSTPLLAVGSDQLAVFSLFEAPVGQLDLVLPAGKFLLFDNVSVPSSTPADHPATYQVSVGGMGELRLQITDRQETLSADSLILATSKYGIRVIPGEVTWQVDTELNLVGRKLDQLELAVPRDLEVTEVTSPGLDVWSLSDDPKNRGLTILQLKYRQPFTKSQTIRIRGIKSHELAEAWEVPQLTIRGVDSHVGQLLVQFPDTIRLRVDESQAVRQTVIEDTESKPQPDSTLADQGTLMYEFWQENFQLRFITEAKERELFVNQVALLEFGDDSMSFNVVTQVEVLYAPLFEVDMELPAEWIVDQVLVNDHSVAWESRSQEAGVHQLRIALPQVLEPGQELKLILQARRDYDNDIDEKQQFSVELPFVKVSNVDLWNGSYAIRAGENWELEPEELQGLDAIRLKSYPDALSYAFQTSEVAGQFKLTKTRLRVRAETVAYHRLERQVLRSHFQCRLHVDRGLLRTLHVVLPASVDDNLQFRVLSGAWRILQQQSASAAGNEQVWTLKLAPLTNRPQTDEISELWLGVDLFTQRDDEAAINAPTFRIKEAELQSGYVVVEAYGEQQLSVKAVSNDGLPLPTADLLELPKSRYQPAERIVAAFRFVHDDYQVNLSEQRFDRVAFPAAVCHQSTINSLIDLEGRLQHQVTYELTTVGVQSIGVSLAEECHLWAAMIDGQPVEVRRLGTRYLVPIANSKQASDRQILTLLYSDVAQSGRTLRQQIPRLEAMSGAGESQSIEVLKHIWNVYHGNHIAITQSQGQFQATSPLDETGYLSQIKELLRFPLEYSGFYVRLGILAGIVVAVLLLVALNRRFSTGIGTVKRVAILGTLVVAGFLATAGMLLMLLVTSSRLEMSSELAMNKTAAQAKNTEQPASGKAAGFGTVTSSDFVEDESRMSLRDDPFGEMSEQVPADSDFDGKEESMPKPTSAPNIEVVNAPNVFPEQDGQDPLPSAEIKRKTRLSIPIQLEVPNDSLSKQFVYFGTDASPTASDLVLTLQALQHYQIIRWCVALFVVGIGWLVRRQSVWLLCFLTLFGLLTPIILAAIAPAGWSAWIDGLFIGTLVALLFGLGYVILRWCYSVVRFGPDSAMDRWKQSTTTALFLVGICSFSFQSATAADPPQTPAAAANQVNVDQIQKNAKVDSSRGTENKTAEHQPYTVYVPYAAGTDPLQSPNVFLTHEFYQTLIGQAESPDALPADSRQAWISAVNYVATINSDDQENLRIIVKAICVIHSRSEDAEAVRLPIRLSSVQNAVLDGQPALIQAVDSAKKILQVVIDEPGQHTLEFELSLPLSQGLDRGRFELNLAEVPTGLLTFHLPEQGTQVDVEGTKANYRVVSAEDKKQLQIPVAAGGTIVVNWRPEMEANGQDAVVHAEAKQSLVVDDRGVSTTAEITWNVRRGQVTELTLQTPQDWKLNDITGKDVGGWEMSIDGPTRRLKLFLRRELTDQTVVNISLFRATDINEKTQVVSFPELIPENVTRDVGTIHVAAEKQFILKPQTAENLRQIEIVAEETPAGLKNRALPVQAAYRYASHPFQLTLAIERPRGRTHVDADHAVLIDGRQVKMTSRFQLRSELAPRSTWQFYVPYGLNIHSVDSVGLLDWYLEGDEDEPTLVLEWDQPRTGTVEVVVSGTTLREERDEPVMIDTLHPFGPDRMRSVVTVRVDEGFSAELEELEDWRIIPINTLLAITQKLHAQPIQFALESQSPEPIPVMVKLTAQVLPLTADVVTLLTISDTSIVHTFALQWQIPHGEVQTLWLTTPVDYENRLEFADPLIRQVTHTKADDNQLLWKLELKSPVSSRHFVAATALMPIPADQVLRPPVITFVKPAAAGDSEMLPLASQRQYVVLVNRSMYQVSANHTENREIILRTELPVVVADDLVTEASEIFRWRPDANQISWQIYQTGNMSQMPAIIHLAHLQQVLAADGSWRTEATYTFRNPSRQFLPLLLPEQCRILSVYVAGKPSRAVQSSHNGQPLWLIPIPKTSISDRSIETRVVLSGQLSGGSLDSQDSSRQQIELPAPQVLSVTDSPETGMTVAQTTWSVFVPRDVDAELVDDNAASNLVLVDQTDIRKLTYELQLKDALDLINTLNLSSASSVRGNAARNLMQLEQEIRGDDSQRGGSYSSGKEGKRLKSLRSQFDKWMAGNRGKVKVDAGDGDDEGDNDVDGVPDFRQPSSQTELLNSSNFIPIEGINTETEELFEYKLQVPAELSSESGVDKISPQKGSSRFKGGKDNFGRRRSEIQQEQTKQREMLYSDLKKNSSSNSFGRQDSQPLQPMQQQVPSVVNGNGNEFGGGVNDPEWGEFAQTEGSADRVFVIPEGQKQAGVVGAMSLPIELPHPDGRQFTFSKVAGNPKLTLAVRFESSHRSRLGWVWAVCWGLAFLALVVVLLKQGMGALWQVIPTLFMVVGVVIALITALPFAVWGYLLFLIGCLTWGWRLRKPAGAETA